MTTDNKYSQILLELKTNYQETLVELKAQTDQIKAKLASLDLLIEDPYIGSDILSILQGEIDFLTSSASAVKIAKIVKTKAESEPKKTDPKASLLSAKKKISSSKRPRSIAEKSAVQVKKNDKTQTKKSSPSSTMLPMKKPFTKMFKIDAIEKILRDNPGKAMHIDDLVLQLYGELNWDDLMVERQRINQIMNKGIEQSRWRKSPEELMCLKKAHRKKTRNPKTFRVNLRNREIW